MNGHVTRRLVVRHTLARIRSHAFVAVAEDGEDEEESTWDALEDKEVVGGDVVDDGEKDEEVQRMYS